MNPTPITTLEHEPSLLRRILRTVGAAVAWTIRIGVIVLLLRYSTPPLGDQWTAVALVVKDAQFDYVGWEVGALAAKANEFLYGVAPFMDEASRSNYVRAYMDDLARARTLEYEIERVYVDPNIADPDAASAELRAQRDVLRADLAQRQTLAEAILEGQVAAVLVDQGFGLPGGQLFPPIAMRFTQVPNLLIVSPRDRIRFDISINLYSLPLEQIEALEAQIDETFDVSSLIVPLGGIALYPAMILETTSIPYAIETFAHEWLHHYLFMFPLGLNYDFEGEVRIINETTANLFGKAIVPLVLRRYYPELAPPDIPPVDQDAPEADVPTPPPPAPPVFDYGFEMNLTRVTVDQLLAEGRVEEAEAYMEERRQLFVENGYGIRKLNQAFFAFYGGYQTGTPGEGGSDPIGPAIAAIRDQSESIHAWIVTMRGITTREALLAAVGE